MLQTFDVNVYNDLREHLRFYKDNYFWSPKYKQGIWDGKITFFKDGKCPIGLTPRVVQFAKEGNYSYSIDFLLDREIDEDRLLQFIDELKKPFDPYDFQIEAFFDIIKKRDMCVISKTGTGKCIKDVELEIEVSDEVYEKYFKNN